MNWKAVLSSFALATSLFASGAQAQVAQGYLPADTQVPPLAACSPNEANIFLPPTTAALLSDDWFNQRDDMYVPFATYSLTPAQQAYYLALIKAFWPGPYDYMQPWEVSDEMAQIINSMLEAVANCSQGIAAVEVFTNLIFEFIQGDFPKTPKEWYDFIEDNFDPIIQAIGGNRYNRKYMICLNSVAWYWRSTFDIVYWDY